MSQYTTVVLGRSTITSMTNAPTVLERPRHITEGAFKDRLGMDALAIGGSSHPACMALNAFLANRRYVDLDRPDLPSLLGILVAAAQPAASALFPGAGPMTAQKIAAIIGGEVREDERA